MLGNLLSFWKFQSIFDESHVVIKPHSKHQFIDIIERFWTRMNAGMLNFNCGFDGRSADPASIVYPFPKVNMREGMLVKFDKHVAVGLSASETSFLYSIFDALRDQVGRSYLVSVDDLEIILCYLEYLATTDSNLSRSKRIWANNLAEKLNNLMYAIGNKMAYHKDFALTSPTLYQVRKVSFSELQLDPNYNFIN